MLSLISPAKINLFLHVAFKRNDGYHELESLFQAISLHDKLHFSKSEKDHLITDEISLPRDDSNLIFKAANLFRRKTGLNFGLKVIVEKNIPQKAGLGGGSSNAATTLWALNEMHDNRVKKNDLIEWSKELGSDVTFFFSSGTAFCTGRGENVQSLPPLPTKKIWIAKKQEGLSTPQVFASLNLEKITNKDTKSILNEFYKDQFFCFNDLELAAFSIDPSLKEYKKKLQSLNFDQVFMTGSGSAFVCLSNQVDFDKQELIETRFIQRKKNSWYNASLKC